MKYLLLICFLLLVASDALSQSAFDSSCYYPELGNPNELDSIYGSKAEQRLGKNLRTLPPLKGQQYDRLVMQGLPDNIPFLSAVETGPDFDLHAMKTTKQYPYVFKEWPNFMLGHFRSPKYTDMLMYDPLSSFHPTIYWADENGEYDSSRYTQLFPFNDGVTYSFPCGDMQPYIGKFTTDSVDDIVLSVRFVYGPIPHGNDSVYMAHVKGGEQLYAQGKVAMWDELAYWGTSKGKNRDSVQRTPIQGDWRGVGREDLITVDDWCTFYYYRNDPPFTLTKFVESLRRDTLLKASEWSQYETLFSYSPGGYSGNVLSMRAFAKQSWDRSMDLVLPLPISTASDFTNANGICLFKGGAEFGSKRLSFDSADFFLHCPGYYSSSFSQDIWPDITNGGDLTGTGNNVLLTSGSPGFTSGYLAFYVLGKALDDKIDVFFPFQYGCCGSDTIVSSEKGNSTFIWGAHSYMTPEDQEQGIFSKGSIRVLYGHEKIPVRLNPKYSVTERSKLDASIHHIIAYPNPCDQKTVLTFDNCTGDKMLVDVINAKGEVCQSEVTPSGYGLQEYALFLNSQPEGTYYIRLTCPRDGWSATTNVVKTGAYQTPWKLDLRKVMGR